MKKTLIIIFIALLTGGIITYLTYKKIEKPIENKIVEYQSAQAFQIGVFSNYDNAKKISDRNNGIIIEEDNKYHVYISILEDKISISKMKEYYDSIGITYYIKTIKVTKTFIDNIKNYETLISKSNKDTYNTINKDIINIYKEYK